MLLYFHVYFSTSVSSGRACGFDRWSDLPPHRLPGQTSRQHPKSQSKEDYLSSLFWMYIFRAFTYTQQLTPDCCCCWWYNCLCVFRWWSQYGRGRRKKQRYRNLVTWASYSNENQHTPSDTTWTPSRLRVQDTHIYLDFETCEDFLDIIHVPAPNLNCKTFVF